MSTPLQKNKCLLIGMRRLHREERSSAAYAQVYAEDPELKAKVDEDEALGGCFADSFIVAHRRVSDILNKEFDKLTPAQRQAYHETALGAREENTEATQTVVLAVEEKTVSATVKKDEDAPSLEDV